MKKIIVALALTLVTAAGAYAQASFGFSNRNLSVGLDTPITLNGSTAGLVGPDYAVDVYLASDLSTPLATQAFVASAAGAGYFLGPVVTIASAADQDVVSLVLRGYDTATGTAEGFSSPFDVTLGGGLSLPGTFANLQTFDISAIPEPSTLAMIALGLGAVALRFRKQAQR